MILRFIRGFNRERPKQRLKLDYLERVEQRSQGLGADGKPVLDMQARQAEEDGVIARQAQKAAEQQAKVNAKKAKRDAKKKQSQMQKARLAKEFDTNRSAGFGFLG